MKYLIRSLKYFLHLTILLVIFVAAIYFITAKGAPLESMFRNGYNSLWSMLAIVAVFAAAYPKVGYGSRTVVVSRNPDEAYYIILTTMESRGYVLDSKSEYGDLVFRKASFVARLLSMFEDKIYFYHTLRGYKMEGRLKEVVRLDSALFQTLENPDE